MLSPPQLGSLASVIAEPFTSCSRTRAFRCADLKARAVLRREATRSSQNSSALRSLIRSWPLGAQFKSGGLLSALDLAVLKRHGVWLLLPTAHGAHFPFVSDARTLHPHTITLHARTQPLHISPFRCTIVSTPRLRDPPRLAWSDKQTWERCQQLAGQIFDWLAGRALAAAKGLR